MLQVKLTSGPKKMDISKRKWYTLILLTLGNFFVGSTVSILAPFYPAEAEKKGASATEYGMVFGIFELIAFVFAPIFGKYLHKLGPRLVLNLGLLAQGIGCLFFGTLDSCDTHFWFISLSFVFRIVEAVGSAGYVTASFAVIAIEFPESMAKTFAGLETAFGAGLIAGPPIGGLLFEIGGYSMPFFVLGGFLLFSACISPLLTPPPLIVPPTDSESVVKSSLKSSGIIELLKIPGAQIAALNVLSAGISNGFICTILEPHIRQFGLSPVGVTGVFVALMGTYALCAPAWGWLCDKVSVTNYVSLTGSIVMLGGCLLIGPAPFLPFNTILWVTVIGCALQGIGTGALNVSSFIQLTEWSKKHGFPEDVTTYGLTSGIWFSMLSLGSFIGPLLAGVLLDTVGFRVGSLLCICEHCIMIILQTIFIISVGEASNGRNTRIRQVQRISEAQPLLFS